LKEKVNTIFDQFGIKVKYVLQKITDIHLYSKIQDEAEGGGDITYIYIFGAIATFMLIIACINYMNLATGPICQSLKGGGIAESNGFAKTSIGHTVHD
jgi:putative ABC transport system permease protein